MRGQAGGLAQGLRGTPPPPPCDEFVVIRGRAPGSGDAPGAFARPGLGARAPALPEVTPHWAGGGGKKDPEESSSGSEGAGRGRGGEGEAPQAGRAPWVGRPADAAAQVSGRGGAAGRRPPGGATGRAGPGHAEPDAAQLAGCEGRWQEGPGDRGTGVRRRVRPGPSASPQKRALGAPPAPRGALQPPPRIWSGVAHCRQVPRRPARPGIVPEAASPVPPRGRQLPGRPLHPGGAAPGTRKLELSRHLRAELLSLTPREPHAPAETWAKSCAVPGSGAIVFLPVRRERSWRCARRPERPARGSPPGSRGAWLTVLPAPLRRAPGEPGTAL